ncbi:MULTISPECIES: N-methyl-L-tryptophan oxidase [unclassified Paenibacillus]|uniref:N-methyl-L-tryptophan oxidase n=1 Tax=unclassified Paenibacillus TaxID=185978 RepID=UPI00362A8969
MNNGYDIIIVGAGSFGMNAGYFTAKSGLRVLLIDAHNPPHEQGSHHGGTRIYRSAYTMGPAYAELALRAGELWSELAEEAKEWASSHYSGMTDADAEIFKKTGVVSIGDTNSSFLQSKQDSCMEFGIPYERLKPKELMDRWPGFCIPEYTEGLYEPQAGVLFSENIIRVYRKLAERCGADFRTNERVESIVSGSAQQMVRTSAGTYYADRVLVCGGAFSAALLPELKQLVRPVRKAIGWFEAPTSLYGSEVFPAFIVNKGGTEEYYGFPDLDGRGVKVGRHDGGETVLPGAELHPFGIHPEDEEDLQSFLNLYLPKVGSLSKGGTCLYENAPGEHFLIGELPERPGIWFAGGGSGHGFKFSSSIGEALSQLLAVGRSYCDLSSFAFQRSL